MFFDANSLLYLQQGNQLLMQNLRKEKNGLIITTTIQVI